MWKADWLITFLSLWAGKRNLIWWNTFLKGREMQVLFYKAVVKSLEEYCTWLWFLHQQEYRLNQISKGTVMVVHFPNHPTLQNKI